MLSRQAERFRESSKRALRGHAQNDGRRGIVFDHNFRSGANADHQPCEIAGRLGLRDVDGCHNPDDTPIPVLPLDESGRDLEAPA